MEVVLNGKYLIKDRISNNNPILNSNSNTNINLVTVINITETSINLVYSNNNSCWYEKDVFYKKFIILEDLTNSKLNIHDNSKDNKENLLFS